MAEPIAASTGNHVDDGREVVDVKNAKPQQTKAQRLVGLDIFRGLTMAVMLIVDTTGDYIPSIDHAPWNGIHLADFVMPFFLFISGISMSISVKAPPGGLARTVWYRVMWRAIKLFIVGLIVQGAFYDFGPNGDPVVRIDLGSFRIMGILQRIAIAIVFVASAELFVPELPRGDATSHRSAELLPVQEAERTPPSVGFGLWLFRTTSVKWLVALFFWALQLGLTYGVKPPSDWPGCSPAGTLLRCDEDGCSPPKALKVDQLHEMGCSGVGWLDSSIFGLSHVYVQGTNQKGGPVNFGFDPEGLVTSFGAVLTMYFGLHIGRAFKTLKAQSPMHVVAHWLICGIPALVIAIVLNTWVPFNKRLWSPSYNLFMLGCGTLLYTVLYLLCDAVNESSPPMMQTLSMVCRCIFSPLQWLGSNCILFFVLSDCCGFASWLIQIVAWGEPHKKHNFIYFWDEQVLGGLEQPARQLVSTFTQLFFYMLLCGLLYRKGIFWKI